ncbi:high choriolytic enzyme 1 [Solenopsis invicta]|uniref:high choriolytic enzyme 1 n=1 Tax=Solenopsis invicta TaxID=13686 RepID=UPI000595FAD8|nr:high choriolytic enzyme 1 [Solenopsis invicta]
MAWWCRELLHHSLTRDPDKVRDLLLSLDVIRRYTKSIHKPCVTFNRVFENSLGRRNWVNITAHDRGCYSNVGRNPNGHNILNLNINDGCFNYIGHAMHEMMHTLGIYHEHSRPDRDKYVQVHYLNIIPEYRHNFNKYNDSFVTTFDYPYDYNSVMHYPTNAFAKRRLYKTLEPIPNAQRPIGQRSILTVYDIYKIRNAYNCV